MQSPIRESRMRTGRAPRTKCKLYRKPRTKPTTRDAAVQTWEKAYQVYLSVLLRALSLEYPGADSEKVAINATLNADAKAKLGKALESAAVAVATSANHLKRSESADAAAAYQEAKNAVEAAETESRSKGVKMGGNGGPDLPPAAASSAAQLRPHPASFPTMCLGSVLHIFKSQSRNWIAERETMNCFSRRWSASFPFSLGVELLWLPAPTWGGFSDCLTAVLWGLGLHQV